MTVSPRELTLVQANLDELPLPLDSGCADGAAAVEAMEHLKNLRAFMREPCDWRNPAVRWS